MQTRRILQTVVLLGAISAPLMAQDALRTPALVGMARVKRDAGDLAASATYWEEARAAHALTASELTEYFWVLTSIDAKTALQVAREVLRTTPTVDETGRDAEAADASPAGAIRAALARCGVQPALASSTVSTTPMARVSR